MRPAAAEGGQSGQSWRPSTDRTVWVPLGLSDRALADFDPAWLPVLTVAWQHVVGATPLLFLQGDRCAEALAVLFCTDGQRRVAASRSWPELGGALPDARKDSPARCEEACKGSALCSALGLVDPTVPLLLFQASDVAALASDGWATVAAVTMAELGAADVVLAADGHLVPLDPDLLPPQHDRADMFLYDASCFHVAPHRGAEFTQPGSIDARHASVAGASVRTWRALLEITPASVATLATASGREAVLEPELARRYYSP